jgi:hypothetical protein
MAWTNWKGFNFRDTAGFVTDGTNEEDVSVAKGGGTAAYPYSETIDGDTFNCGWISGMGNMRDRNAGNDRRLAGCHFATNGTDSDGNRAFVIDLPAAGDYEIRLAFGDTSGDDHYWKVFDDTTLLETVGPKTNAANEWFDANGTNHTSSANWAANQTPKTYTFATTTCKIRIGHGGTGVATRIAHMAIRQSAAPALTQSRYRWRNDDGSETGATWAAAENTAITLAQNTPRRLRVQVQSTNDKPSASYKLQYRKVGDPGWDDVT